MSTDDAAVADARPAPRRGGNALTSKPWWPTAKRVLTITFFLLVLGLIVHQARQVDWDAALKALRAYRLPTLAIAAGLAAASYLIYTTFELIGRHQTGHTLKTRQVMFVSFVSYAVNLNLGSWIGGIAFRYRLYTRRGLKAGVIARIFGLSLVTNWVGYLLLAGLVFSLRPLVLPPEWKLGSEGLRVLGAACLTAVVGYLTMCFVAKRRVWSVRGHELKLPSGRVALLQLLVSSTNWMLMTGAVYTLLQGRIEYTTVLSVLLIAAIAGVITHVPAGLGVLEAVFVTLLAHRVPKPELLAALLAYRAIYYLLPLGLATILFLIFDARAPKPDGAGG